MGFPLTNDQRAAVENTGGPLLVSAAAGAGKTRVLVERLMDRVARGANVDEFLMITFTNAAAAELRGRILEELNGRLAQTPGDRHLRRQITLAYQAHISTIHAFCGEVLRQWGHLLELDPDHRLMDEGEAGLVRGEALEALLERRYETAQVGDGFDLLLDTFSAGRDDQGLAAIVLEIYEKLQSHPEPAQWLARQRSAYALEGVEDAAQTVWGSALLDAARRRAGYWRGKLAPLLDRCRTGVAAYCPSLEVTLEGLEALEKATSWDGAGAVEFPRLGSSAKCKDPQLAQRVKDLRERCKGEMSRLAERLMNSSKRLLDDLRDTAPAVDALLALVEEFARDYSALKAKRNVLDFDDLEHKTLELLQKHPQAAQAIRAQFREVMVDEYQDTNQAQNAIFDALTQDTGALFMVGDVKQSIYRFRLADPTLFLEKYRAYPPYTRAVPGQGRRVTLGENFRSRPEVIDSVNFVFENLMSRGLGELEYGPEEALRCGGSFPPGGDHRTELYILENPKAEQDGDETMVEPRFLARRLGELVAQGFPVSDGKGGVRPVRPGDMAILLRSPNRVMGRYLRALAEVGLPWRSEGAEDFFDTPETSVALSFLEIMDNPRQDVPLVAALRSPVYGFSPDRLAQLRRRNEGCFYDALLADDGPDVREFLRELEQLRFLAGDLSAHEALWELYRRTGLLELYAAGPGGQERREHLLALYGYARQYEGAGYKGVFGFLNHLRRRRERGEGLTAPGGSGEDGVRIMSIHRSKGLEYPVVAVGGLGKGFNRQDSYAPMLFHRELGLGPKGLDRERRIQYPTLARWAVADRLEEEMRSEELRLLYVAMTRAREKLILSIAMKEPVRELKKLLEDAGLPPDPEALAAQPTVGHWILSAALCRPEAQALREKIADAPPRWENGAWGSEWVISLVDGEPYRTGPSLRGQVVEAPEKEPEEFPDYNWRYPFQGAVDVPSKLTATQLKGRELDREITQEALPAPRPILFDRPHFARTAKGLTPGERGTAHHLVMQYLDFSKADSLEGIRAEIARMTAQEIITPQQGEAVDPAVILAFFRAPLGREAAENPTLRREFKFSVLADAGDYYPSLPPGEQVLLQGVVDCWYETPRGLVVIDFKSDRVTEETVAQRAEEYRPQLDAYSRALSQIVGRPVVRRALWFFSLRREIDV